MGWGCKLYWALLLQWRVCTWCSIPCGVVVKFKAGNDMVICVTGVLTGLRRLLKMFFQWSLWNLMRTTVEQDSFVKDVGDQKAGVTDGRIHCGRGGGSIILLALPALKSTETLRVWQPTNRWSRTEGICSRREKVACCDKFRRICLWEGCWNGLPLYLSAWFHLLFYRRKAEAIGGECLHLPDCSPILAWSHSLPPCLVVDKAFLLPEVTSSYRLGAHAFLRSQNPVIIIFSVLLPIGFPTHSCLVSHIILLSCIIVTLFNVTAKCSRVVVIFSPFTVKFIPSCLLAPSFP